MREDQGKATIRILDEQTVNQIAAGEVVERPASVVKELIENAIDAGARTIRVEITSSGDAIRAVRVVDDGGGMTAADAVLAFSPHATSKIEGISDLERCATLGFRGEALASIAAVSEVTMITRPRGTSAISGTKVVIRGGAILEVSETGAPEGTSVIVEDLFFNTPARKKFQKSLPVELAQIFSIGEGICLAHPSIAFRIVHNGRARISTPSGSRLLDTIVSLYGTETGKALIPLEERGRHLHIRGYISQPYLSRQNPDQIIISINGRLIRSRSIGGAVKEAYGTLLPKDRYPVAFLELAIDTSFVDVNVHPTKREVRISHEKEILSAITGAVERVLRGHDLIAGEPGNPQVQIPLLPEEGEASGPYDHTPSVPGGVKEPDHTDLLLAEQQLRRTMPPSGLSLERNRLPDMEVIGQIGDAYILATTREDDLILIDQHAAHERILYDQVTGKEDDRGNSQELLVPVVIHLTPREAAAMQEARPLLEEKGFIIDAFGRDTCMVRAVPAVLGRLEDRGLIHETIADLLSEDSRKIPDTRERVSRVIACRGALKAGTSCSKDQCRALIDQLSHTGNPYTCPHGRPTLVTFSREKLDAMFKRS
jgi:DNA mismatch repair protein MutL